MRILVAVHGFPPTHSSGAERQAERAARWLARHGHDVVVFAIEEVGAPHFRLEPHEQDGYLVYRMSYNVKEAESPFRGLYDHPLVGRTLRMVFARHAFDVVHVMSGYLLGPQAVDAAHECGLPVAITLTEYWFLCKQLNLLQPAGKLCTGPETDMKCTRCVAEERRRYRWPALVVPGLMDALWKCGSHFSFAQETLLEVTRRRVALRRALDAAELVVCNSRFMIGTFSRFGFDTTRYALVKVGLEPPAVCVQRALEGPGHLRLGYIGQLKEHKGVDLLIDAVIRLLEGRHPVTLDIWGSETEEPAYVSKLKKRSTGYPAIRWNGRYTGARVWEVLAAMDALAVPSRWYENSPNAILEAYLMRVPVVATNLGGMAELVEPEKCGLTFTLNDPDDLYDRLKRLATEPGLLERLRDGIPPVKTIDEEMGELVEKYSQLCAGRFSAAASRASGPACIESSQAAAKTHAGGPLPDPGARLPAP